MLSESESGITALRVLSQSRGMTALWYLVCLPLLLPFCVEPAKIPIASPADSMSSEISYLEDTVVSVGDTLEILCDLGDLSEPVVWYKDGAGLVQTNRTQLGQRLLRIISVSYKDSGVYACSLAHSKKLLNNNTVRVTDSLSSGDDEDYDEDPEDAGNTNGESLFLFFGIYILWFVLNVFLHFCSGNIADNL